VREPAGVQVAILELEAPGRLDDDLVGVDTLFEERGVRVLREYAKNIVRGRVPIDRDTFVAGQLPTIRAALRQLGVQPPEPEDYPPSSAPFLQRHVWPSTLGSVRRRLENDDDPVFVKPRGTAKRFTGRVVRHSEDFRVLPVSGDRVPVWCSEIVDMVSEHRVFVIEGSVVGVRCYDGDAARSPASADISEMVDAMGPDLPAGCAFDVAVLSNGNTVLIEVNEGFSLGRYGLPVRSYADLLLARWRELVRTA
jgi:hypothetical protein